MNQFDSDDAIRYGLAPAILLGQARYISSQCVRDHKDFHYGHHWVYRSTRAWTKELPFYNRTTILAALKKLRDAGELVQATEEMTDLPGDYRCYHRLGQVVGIQTNIHLSSISNTDEGLLVINPTKEQVAAYFDENGYDPAVGEQAFDYYMKRSWCDRYGNPVRNWKRTMQRIWFKNDNRKRTDTLTGYGI